MAVCEWCGEEFDEQDAEQEFESETFLLAYGNLRKCLCGSCAVQAINDQVDGVYFETCEKCEREFDYVEECRQYGISLTDWDGDILCGECILEKLEKLEEEAGDEN